MTWHVVAHRCELAKPNDFVQVPLNNVETVALTNFDGEIVAWDGRCTHRGMAIYADDHGNMTPRCKYHSRVARAADVKRYEIGMIGGFILVRDSFGVPHEPTDAPGDIFKFLADAQALTFHSAISFVMDCDWTVAVENALDSQHLEHVHPDSLAKLALVSESQTFYGKSSIERFSSHSGRLGHLSRFFPDEQRFDYVHAHIYPYSAVSSTRGWTYSLQRYVPRPDGRTNFIHRLYAGPTTRPLPEFFDSVARLNEQIFREDAEICARVPAGHAGPLSDRERRIAHFREACRPSPPYSGITEGIPTRAKAFT